MYKILKENINLMKIKGNILKGWNLICRIEKCDSLNLKIVLEIR